MTKKKLYEQILSCINQLQSLQYGALSMKEAEMLTNFEKEIVFMSYRTGMNLNITDGIRRDSSADMSASVARETSFAHTDDTAHEEATSAPMEEDNGQDVTIVEEETSDEEANEGAEVNKDMHDSLSDENADSTSSEEELVTPADFSEHIHDLDDDETDAEDTQETVEINLEDDEQVADSDMEENADDAEVDADPDEESETVSVDLDDVEDEDTNEEASVLIGGMPTFHSVGETELFTDETRKSLMDFVYSRKIIALKAEETATRGAIAEQMVVSAFPLTVAADDGNAKIFAVVEHDGQLYHASSYDNANGSSILQMKVNGFEICIMGMWTNYQFSARIFTSGATAQDGVVVEEMESIDNTPVKNRIKNGHIKFSYEDSGNDIGTIEVFPVSDSATKTHLFYIRKVDAFTDYGELGQRVVTINTVEGYKNLSINVIQGDLEVTLISQEL